MGKKGIAPTIRKICCPYCRIDKKEFISELRSTDCKVTYKCNSFLEPFEYISRIILCQIYLQNLIN